MADKDSKGKQGKKGRRTRAVLQYTKTGEFVKEYPSIIEAAEATDTYASNIIACANGTTKSACGYVWRRVDESSTKRKRYPAKAIDQYDKDNCFIKTYKSIAEAARMTGVPRSSIGGCVAGVFPHAGNFIFIEHGKDISKRKVSTPHGHGIKIDQYSLDGEFIQTFESLYLAAKACGAHQPNISNCLRGNIQSTGGYRWTIHGEKLPSINYEKCRKRRVAEVDGRGNILKIYSSIAECITETGLSKFSIRRELYSDHNFIRPRNFMFVDTPETD